MLMAPRLIEALVQTLEAEPLLADERAVPGGIWRDVIPQDVGACQPSSWPSWWACPTPTTPRCSTSPSRRAGKRRAPACSRCARRWTRWTCCCGGPRRRQGGFDGIKFGAGRKTQEIERTTVEAGQLFAHLGGQYTYTCSEPPLSAQ
jgi:hypothetical protein